VWSASVKGTSGTAQTVDQLLLEGGEEAFGDGIVPALARSRERLKSLVSGEERRSVCSDVRDTGRRPSRGEAAGLGKSLGRRCLTSGQNA
jgi:hypothetical protein